MSAFSRRQFIGALGLSGGLGALGGLASLAALAGCSPASVGGGTARGGGARRPILIGAAASATGSNARAGEYQTQAYQLWEEQVNQRGGVLGRPVKLIVYDDTSDPATGVRLYEKLITEDNVDLVLGPSASSAAQAASTVTEKYRIPMLAAGASASEIWKRKYKYVFGVHSVAETYFNGLVELALTQGYTTIAIINEDTLFPKATARGTAAYANSKGMQVVYQEQYPTKVTDVSALLSKIKTANPDMLVGGSYQPDAVLITRQAKELDVNPKLLAFSAGALLPDFLQSLAQDADYVFSPSIWEPSLETPGNKEFVDSFQKKWNREPDYHAATGFAAGQILEAALKKANTLDKEKIREALASQEITTILPGKYKVDGTGMQIAHVPLLLQWQAHERPIVWPDQFATGRPKLPTPPWKSR